MHPSCSMHIEKPNLHRERMVHQRNTIHLLYIEKLRLHFAQYRLSRKQIHQHMQERLNNRKRLPE